jgi:excisionase family DNA binding protein
MTTPTLNVKTAADLLQVHPNTVEKLIASCQIPAARVGRAYVILTKDVMAYIENQVCRQTAERMRTVVSQNSSGTRVTRKI